MVMEFQLPEFKSGKIKVCLNGADVAIYGTTEGLLILGKLCIELADKKKVEHLHFEDYDVLTRDSLKLVIAAFVSEGTQEDTGKEQR